MCDSCKSGVTDVVLRGAYYFILKKVLDMGPAKAVVDIISGGLKNVAEAVDSPSGTVFSTRADPDDMQKTAVYALASWFYENYLYNQLKSMNMNYSQDMWGICGCELMRDLYLVVILQLYSVIFRGFRVEPLITDIVAVFGADKIDKLLGGTAFFMKKERALPMVPVIPQDTPGGKRSL